MAFWLGSTMTAIPRPLMNATALGKNAGKNPVEGRTRRHNLAFAGFMVLVLPGALITCWLWSSGNRVQEAIHVDADAMGEIRRG